MSDRTPSNLSDTDDTASDADSDSTVASANWENLGLVILNRVPLRDYRFEKGFATAEVNELRWWINELRLDNTPNRSHARMGITRQLLDQQDIAVARLAKANSEWSQEKLWQYGVGCGEWQ